MREGVFQGPAENFPLYLFPLGEVVLVGAFRKSFLPSKSSQRESSKCAGSKKLFFSSLIPSGRSHFGGCFEKSFVSSKGRQRETRFFTSVLNIPSLIPTGRGRLGSHSQKIFYPQRVGSESDRKLRLGRNFYFPSRLFTERGQKLCLYRNFHPSRGRSREKPKIKPFEKIFFFPQQVGNEDNQKPRLCRKKFSFSSGRARKRRFYEWF